jgi:hypothetical protein
MVPSKLGEMVRNYKFDNPFNIVEIALDNCISFSSLSNQFLYTNKLKMNSLLWIKIKTSGFPDILTRQTFNKIKEWKKYHIFKKKTARLMM